MRMYLLLRQALLPAMLGIGLLELSAPVSAAIDALQLGARYDASQANVNNLQDATWRAGVAALCDDEECEYQRVVEIRAGINAEEHLRDHGHGLLRAARALTTASKVGRC